MSILDQDFRGADPANLEAVYLALRDDQRWTRLIPVVDARFEGRVGIAPGLSSLGPDAIVEWLDELRSVVQEAKAHIDDLLDRAEIDHSGLRYAWEEYGRDFDGGLDGLVARFSEIMGGAEPLSLAEFVLNEAWLRSARAALDNDDVDTASTSCLEAAQRIEETQKRWNDFLDDARSGAGGTVVALEFTRTASFVVVTGLATGGASSALGVTSVLGRAAVGGIVATGVRGVEGVSTYAGHVLAGTTESFDVDAELVEVVKSGAGQFAGAAVAGWLAGYSDDLARTLAERLVPHLGEQSSAWATYAVQSAASQAGGSVAQTVAASTIDVAVGYRFDSTTHLLDYLGSHFLASWRDNIVQQIVEDCTAGNTFDTDLLVRKVSAVLIR
jgi:hypothetical protein